MGFSGGGGTTGVSNHVHSSSVGEGGSLSQTLTEMESGLIYSRIILGA